MSEKLFDGFQGVSSAQWKQLIQYELKGADYNELVWESLEGIRVKPFYHGDESQKPVIPNVPDSFAICQEIFVHDVEKSAHRAADSVKRGAEEIAFVIPTPETDILPLLEKLQENIPLYFRLRFLSADFIRKYDKAFENRTVYIIVDPIHQLASDGNWFEGDDNLKTLASFGNSNAAATISVDGRLYQNAGANSVQQIAYILAHAVEYLNAIGGSSKLIVIQTAVGSNYFFEIAKLRALRTLFDTVAAEFNHTGGCRIIATPSRRNKTLYDYNVNMLRTTTECMSAILGGADSVMNLPYDALYHKSNEFGERIARNQLLILKNESYFDRATSAANGSYYIEELTRQLSAKSLELLKQIEAAGGFLKLLRDGTITRKIQESAEKEQALFDAGKEVLIGTNKYPNQNDRMKDDLELYPFVKIKPRKTLVTPIIEKRLSEKTEQERLKSEEA